MSFDLDTLREGWDFEAKLAGGQDGRGKLPKSFWETYVAMANTFGGIVMLGAQEREDRSLSISGIADPERVERELWNGLTNPQKVSINLLARDDVQREEIDGKIALVVRIPRADRRRRPVFLGGNPLRGTFVRTHEGDHRADESLIRRMIADAEEVPWDSQIVAHYSFENLDPESIAAYRNLFRSGSPTHPFLTGSDQEMLSQLGGWKRELETGSEGPTLAGLLMFGKMRSILDRLARYQLDYRHIPPGDGASPTRWLDRVSVDGTWSGNLFDFYRRVLPKLRDGLSVPFRLGPDLFRREETPQHEALREALVNSLIHADYLGAGGVRVLRTSTSFEFINPGLLRMAPEQIRAGGKSDCRNPALQLMFQMIGAGEKAGSGFPKILQAWREQHWRAPSLEEHPEQDEVRLRLSTLSLFPPEVTEEMERRFPGGIERLNQNERLAVATGVLEGRVTNERLQELTDLHPRDITYLLKGLVEQGFLVLEDKRRWSFYTVTRGELPEEFANLLHNEGSSPHKEGSSHHNGASSHHNDESSHHNEQGSMRDEKVKLAGERQKIVEEVGEKRRVSRERMEEAILAVCDDRYLSAPEIAELLQRKPVTLKNHYVTRMVRERKLTLKYPERLNHPDQRYRTTK